MSKRLLRRGLHAVAISAVAGASVLAPAAAVADDATAANDLDTSESATAAPGDTPDPSGQQPTPGTDENGVEPIEPQDPEVTPPSDPETTPPAGEEQLEDQDAELEKEEPGVSALVEQEPIVPDTGFGKDVQPIRVGVTLADGTFVPDGVTTAGSELLVVETAPDGTVVGTRECTTEADTASDGDPATYCDLGTRPPLSAATAGVSPLAVVFPENPDTTQDSQVYLADADNTVTVTQVSLPDGLVPDPDAAVVGPCEDEFVGPVTFCSRKVALLEARGLPPVAEDDTASTQEGTPVDIDVLANDDTVAGAPLTGLGLSLPPSNGTVRVVGTGEDAEIRYTPAEGFSGTDTFSYGLSTPNGNAFADVTVVVEPAIEPVADRVDRAPATVAALPDAGGPGRSVFGWAAALMVAGAGALALGRRRDVHAS